MNQSQVQPKPLKIVLINHSDTLGGASVVTTRLMNALRAEGADARMVVYTKNLDSPYISTISSRYKRGLRFLIERGVIYLGNGMNKDDLFKVSIANTGTRLEKHPWVREADVIILNWINQGMMSLKGLSRLGKLGKPILWTMHDMWCMTGICHHAYGCKRFEQECGLCPFLGARKEDDLSRKAWLRKKEVYDRVPITFVAVSNWLGRKAAESSLLSNRPVCVIPNAFPVETFNYKRSDNLRPYGLDVERNFILFGAARIDDPIKGLDYAIDALNYIFDNNPDIAIRSAAVFFGELRDKSRLDRLRFSHLHVGRVDDPRMLRLLYANAKVILSTSLYETLPGTLIEGQAAGCLAVTFGMGGQADIVDHLHNGYIARYKDVKDVADGILWALEKDVDRRELHDEVGRRFAASSVARSYLDVIDRMLSGKK